MDRDRNKKIHSWLKRWLYKVETSGSDSYKYYRNVKHDIPKL